MLALVVFIGSQNGHEFCDRLERTQDLARSDQVLEKPNSSFVFRVLHGIPVDLRVDGPWPVIYGPDGRLFFRHAPHEGVGGGVGGAVRGSPLTRL